MRRHLQAAEAVVRISGSLNGELRGGDATLFDANVGAYAVLEQLTGQLMGLDQDKLPLRVMSILPLTTAVRNMAASPITAHPLAFKDGAPVIKSSGRCVCLYLCVCVCVCVCLKCSAAVDGVDVCLRAVTDVCLRAVTSVEKRRISGYILARSTRTHDRQAHTQTHNNNE